MSSQSTRPPADTPEDTATGETIDVYSYHERTKHRFDGYARGPDTIDWDRQPDPVRRFEGAPLIELPLHRAEKSTWFQTVDLNAAFDPEPSNARPVSIESLAVLLEYSLALSAWKQFGAARWAVRCNPSSGNLHPTEAYLIILGVSGLDNGVYHYRADRHGLEQRCHFLNSPVVSSPQVFIGLSSVHWREAWKYGERAYRYCQLDAGHAIAALSFAATLNGWTLEREAMTTGDLSRLLGTDRSQDFIPGETESSDCLLRLHFPQLHFTQQSHQKKEVVTTEQLLSAAANGDWRGQAVVLDQRHFYDWPVIDAIATQTCRQSVERNPDQRAVALQKPARGDYIDNLATLILRRRSAQAFDGKTEIDAKQFFVMLDHLLSRPSSPWAALSPTLTTADTAVHCVFFVHRVAGLKPGLYALPRTDDGETLMREQLRDRFLWERIAGAPEHLPFYLLLNARAERTAAKLSCQQPIAGDSAFSLCMLAEFDGSVADAPQRYPELYWEAGVLGQVLYLEAEGIGCQGTGIGCFFDDGVHELLGIYGTALQSLYHFTVGGAVRDNRLVSFAPYRERSG